jgi:hypothetical protein
LDAEFDALVMKGLRRIPQERYPSAAEFLRSVEAYSSLRERVDGPYGSPGRALSSSCAESKADVAEFDAAAPLSSRPSTTPESKADVARLDAAAPLSSRPSTTVVLFIVGIVAALAVALGLIVVLRGGY